MRTVSSSIDRSAVATAALVIVTLLLVACGASTSAGPTASGTASSDGPPATSGETIRIGLLLPDLSNATLNDVYLGAVGRAEEIGNIEIIQGGSADTQAWNDACNGMVAAQVDYLIYDTLDGIGTSQCIQDANAANIPAICMFACVAEGEDALLITLDFHNNGLIVGRWLAERLGGEGSIGILGGPVGDQAAQDIASGVRDALRDECPDCVIVADVPSGPDRQSGFSVATDTLTANPDIDAMWGQQDEIALGIQSAVEQSDRADSVVVAGHNGTCEALGSVLNGDLDFTLLIAGQPFGIAAIDAVVEMSQGRTPESPLVEPISIDTETANAILNGSSPDPAGVDVRARLEAAQSGCE